MKRMFLTAFICSLSQTMSSQPSDNIPYKVATIQAFLFYNENNAVKGKNVAGTYSANVIDNKDFSLWNTIIGEGSAEGDSRQTLIVVTISGNPSNYTKRQIQFSATSNGKSLLKRSDDFAILDNNDRYYLAYILYGTGCGKVQIAAKILNNGKVESQLDKSIDFECGE